MQPAVYIMSNHRHGVIYTGVTSRIIERVQQHKDKTASAFTARYNADKLVHVEQYEDMAAAIAREKQLKKWPREWKLTLVDEANPEWRDLHYDLV